MTTYVASLTNPAAESGNTSGWTVETGSFGVRSASPAPYAGGYYFYAGSSAVSVMRQRVDLVALGWSTAQLDDETVFAVLSAMLSGFDGGNDPARIGLRFLDASLGTVIEHYSQPWTTNQTWTENRFIRTVPAGTRYVDILLRGNRTGGTNNDAYFDSVSLTTQDTFPTPPELLNPGAEATAGFPSGWEGTNTTNNTVRTTDPAPYSGSHYFSTYATGNILYQRFDLRALGHLASEIDSGALEATINGMQSGYGDNDLVYFGFRFFDGSLGAISEAYSPAYSDADHVWVARSFSAPIPATARFMDVALTGTNVFGAATNAFWDDLSFSTQVSTPPAQPVAGQIPVSLIGTANLDNGATLIATGRIEATPRARLAGAVAPAANTGNFFLLF